LREKAEPTHVGCDSAFKANLALTRIALFASTRMLSFARYWLPLLVWMLVIFSASADAQSTQHTSRFLEPFLRWLKPDITPEAIDAVRWLVRKTAHVVEFAVLAWLAWRALWRPHRADTRPWSWRTARWVLLIVVLYAATDEFHQTFVPNRTGSWVDVCIDTAGGVLGLALTRVAYYWKRRPRKE
jgi:VanZ family protein